LVEQGVLAQKAKQYRWLVQMRLSNYLILSVLRKKKLERIMVDDFVPDHNLPESLKKQLPPKKKKPKKDKNRNKPRYGKDSNSQENKAKKKKDFWGNKSNKKSKNNKLKTSEKPDK